MPRDASTNFARFWLLFMVVIMSINVGAALVHREYWTAAFVGAFAIVAAVILGALLYVREG